jgi:hypothetical protein
VAIKISGNNINNVHTGVSVPQDADVEIGSNEITNARVAIEIRDAQSLHSLLGLSPSTPREELRELLHQLSVSNNPAQVEGLVKSTKLTTFLANGANLTTLVSGLVQLRQSGLLKAALSVVGG